MSYNPTTGKIAAPVSIYDIRQALGVSPTDLGTLCKHANINMWAKYKPVQLYNVKDTTGQWDFTNKKWKSSADWWRGLSQQIGGITVPGYVGTVSQVLALYDGGANGWIYNKPAGGIHPFRLTDFAQYNHNAPQAIENFYIPQTVIQDGHFFASALMSMPAADADYLTLFDMTSAAFQHLYFGVAIVSMNGDLLRRCTSAVEGDAGVTVDLSSRRLPANNDYKVYPFFCDTVLNITDTLDPSGIRCLPCPYLTYTNIHTVSRDASADISVAAEWKQINGQWKIYVTIINGDSRDYEHSYIYVMPMEYWSNPGPNVSHRVDLISDFSLPSQQTSTYVFTLSQNNYFIYCTFQNGTYTRKTNILEPYAPQT